MTRCYQLDFSDPKDIGRILDDLLYLTSDTVRFEVLFNDDEMDDTQFSLWFRWCFVPGKGGVLLPPGDEQEDFRFEDKRNNAESVIGTFITDDAFHFFTSAAEAGFRSKLEELVTQIGNLQARTGKSIWANEETLLGSEPAFILAWKDPKYLPLYTWFIKMAEEDGLDHEMLQGEGLQCLINRHSYTDAMIRHLGAVASRTQFGDETLHNLLRSKELAGYIAEHDMYNKFRSIIEEEFSESRLYSGAEFKEYFDDDFEMIFRNLAPDDYLLIDVSGKRIAVTGEGPIPREEFELILSRRGALIDKKPAPETDYLVYPVNSKEPATGDTQTITYDNLFSLPAYKNMTAEKEQAFRDAVRERNLERFLSIKAEAEYLLTDELRLDLMTHAVRNGGVDELFTFFLKESNEDDKQIILQLLAGDSADYSTEKLKYILENHPPEKKDGVSCAAAAAGNKAGSSAVQNKIQNLALLQEYGFDFSNTAGLASTPLHTVCDDYDYSIELADVLLRLGFDPNASDDRNRTPLGIAAGTRDRDFYKTKTAGFVTDWKESGVERYRYDKFNTDGKRGKDHPYQKGFDLVKLIVESGKADLDFEKQETSGLQSPLMQAAWTGNWQIIDYLLDTAKPNTLPGHTTGDNDPFPCWMVRCKPEEFNIRVFKKAFEKGVHPEQCDNYGRNTLFYLTWRGRNCNPEAIAYLIDRGGNPFQEDGNGDSCARDLADWDDEHRDELLSFIETEKGRAVLGKIFEL